MFFFLNHHYQHYNHYLFVAEAESRCQGSTGNCSFSGWRVGYNQGLEDSPWDPQKMKKFEQTPPILQNEEFEQTTNPSK